MVKIGPIEQCTILAKFDGIWRGKTKRLIIINQLQLKTAIFRDSCLHTYESGNYHDRFGEPYQETELSSN